MLFYFSSRIFACSKPADESDNQPPGPRTLSDTATLLFANWRLVKDSVVSTNYYFFDNNGARLVPNAGVYIGVAGDFMEFLTNGKWNFHGNNQSYTGSYQLLPGGIIDVFERRGQGLARILELTQTRATIYWEDTSPNGGHFHDRMYLQR